MEQNPMENRKPEKRHLLPVLVILAAALLLAGVLWWVLTPRGTPPAAAWPMDESQIPARLLTGDEGTRIVCLDWAGSSYCILGEPYRGSYDLQIVNLTDREGTEPARGFETQQVMSLEEYARFCSDWGLTQKYTAPGDYLVFSCRATGMPIVEAALGGVIYDGAGTATLCVWDRFSGSSADCVGYLIAVPAAREVQTVEVQPLYTRMEFNRLAGRNPLEGHHFSTEDNAPLAEACRLHSGNETLDGLVNAMLDAMAQQHTICVENDSGPGQGRPTAAHWDLIHSVARHDVAGEAVSYMAYGHRAYLLYTGGEETGYQFSEGWRGHDQMLLDLLRDYELLRPSQDCTVEITSSAGQVVISLGQASPVQRREIYTLDAETHLLLQVETEGGDYCGTDRFRYSEEDILLPLALKGSATEMQTAEKPLLYLYPREDTVLTVSLGFPERLTCTYPAYDAGWQVLARPDGSLTDLRTGRQLYALYWEGRCPIPAAPAEGFVVRGADTAAFLEEKLALLGLTEREAEEFIVYWLPRMQDNPYNLIRFATPAEIDAAMPLSFSTEPDSLIRVWMEYRPLAQPVEIPEQTLTSPARTGFTAVEWGGTELP